MNLETKTTLSSFAVVVIGALWLCLQVYWVVRPKMVERLYIPHLTSAEFYDSIGQHYYWANPRNDDSVRKYRFFGLIYGGRER